MLRLQIIHNLRLKKGKRYKSLLTVVINFHKTRLPFLHKPFAFVMNLTWRTWKAEEKTMSMTKNIARTPKYDDTNVSSCSDSLSAWIWHEFGRQHSALRCFWIIGSLWLMRVRFLLRKTKKFASRTMQKQNWRHPWCMRLSKASFAAFASCLRVNWCQLNNLVSLFALWFSTDVYACLTILIDFVGFRTEIFSPVTNWIKPRLISGLIFFIWSLMKGKHSTGIQSSQLRKSHFYQDQLSKNSKT